MKIHTTAEAATLTGISRSTILNRARAGKVGRKPGREWLFTATDIATLKRQGAKMGGPKFVTGNQLWRERDHEAHAKKAGRPPAEKNSE